MGTMRRIVGACFQAQACWRWTMREAPPTEGDTYNISGPLPNEGWGTRSENTVSPVYIWVLFASLVRLCYCYAEIPVKKKSDFWSANIWFFGEVPVGFLILIQLNSPNVTNSKAKPADISAKYSPLYYVRSDQTGQVPLLYTGLQIVGIWMKSHENGMILCDNGASQGVDRRAIPSGRRTLSIFTTQQFKWSKVCQILWSDITAKILPGRKTWSERQFYSPINRHTAALDAENTWWLFPWVGNNTFRAYPDVQVLASSFNSV